MGKVKEYLLDLAYKLADRYCEENNLAKNEDSYHDIVDDAQSVILNGPEADGTWDVEWVYEWRKQNPKDWGVK